MSGVVAPSVASESWESGDGACNEWQRHATLLNREFGGRTLLHCPVLIHGAPIITFGKLLACCQGTHGKPRPLLCELPEPNVTPEAYLAGLAAVIRANQTEDGPCLGCDRLVPTDMPDHIVDDFIGSFALSDFRGCNSACVYCDDSEREWPVKYTASIDHTALFQNLLSSGLVRPGHSVVAWGGGEPTLLRTFEDTVDSLRANRIFQTINTSGIKFSPAIERALRDGVATVRISPDAGTEEAYVSVKRNRHFEDVWTNVSRYAALGGDLVVKYVIFEMNSDISEVVAFIDRCVSSGARRVCISVDFRAAWNADADGEHLTDKELLAAAAMWHLARSHGLSPYFESLWTADQLERVGELGGFNPHDPLSNEATPEPAAPEGADVAPRESLPSAVAGLAVRAARKAKRLLSGSL